LYEFFSVIIFSSQSLAELELGSTSTGKLCGAQSVTITLPSRLTSVKGTDNGCR
jgi:hypothetical protein